MSERGLTKDQVDSIIQFLKENDWQEAFEPNQYLIAKFVKGNNNVKIYATKGHGYTLVCNTEILKKQVLDRKFIDATQFTHELEVDDSGVGCPIGGVVIGFKIPQTQSQFQDGRKPDLLFSKIVDVKYFQSPYFEQKKYLEEVTTKILETLQEHNIPHNDWLIKICTGYIFSHARPTLIESGYNVTTAEITGMLQESVEQAFRHYLEMKCHIPGYLLKTIPTSPKDHKIFFSKLIQYIRGHTLLLPFCKTGWPFFKNNFAQYLNTK
jgi:hypothetical protein